MSRFVDGIIGFLDAWRAKAPGVASPQAVQEAPPVQGIGQKTIEALMTTGLYDMAGVQQPAQQATVSFEMLRRARKGIPVIGSIIKTRKEQISTFARVSQNYLEPGFRVLPRDPSKELSDEDNKRARQLERWFLQSGREDGRPLRELLSCMVEDALVLDAVAIELQPGEDSESFPLVRWVPMDAAEIRLVDENYQPTGHGEALDPEDARGKPADPIRYVQMIEGKVRAEYTSAELAYGIRNPSTERASAGYGSSELENMISVLIGLTYADKFNLNHLMTDRLPAGFFKILGNIDDGTINVFRDSIASLLLGRSPGNQRPPAIKLPTMPGETHGSDILWQQLRATPQDVQYYEYYSLLVMLACSMYQIHPSELGLDKIVPNRSALSEASPQSQLDYGMDKGLLPLLLFFEEFFNDHIMKVLDPEEKFAFRFWGYKTRNAQADLEFRTRRAQFFTSINYERREMGLPAIDEWWADIVLHPSIMQSEGYKQTQVGEGEEGQPASSSDSNRFSPWGEAEEHPALLAGGKKASQQDNEGGVGADGSMQLSREDQSKLMFAPNAGGGPPPGVAGQFLGGGKGSLAMPSNLTKALETAAFGDTEEN
jgi:hypothetical protein